MYQAERRLYQGNKFEISLWNLQGRKQSIKYSVEYDNELKKYKYCTAETGTWGCSSFEQLIECLPFEVVHMMEKWGSNPTYQYPRNVYGASGLYTQIINFCRLRVCHETDLGENKKVGLLEIVGEPIYGIKHYIDEPFDKYLEKQFHDFLEAKKAYERVLHRSIGGECL